MNVETDEVQGSGKTREIRYGGATLEHKIRYWEYYDLQETFDQLFTLKTGKSFINYS